MIQGKTKEVYFRDEDNIVNPCLDNVFKAVFTKDTPESRGALQKLLSAIIGRDLQVIVITANEPPVEQMKERQIRYDISCRLSDGEVCNIEMTLNPNADEPLRLEYYSGKLFTGQNIRGQDHSYKDLKHSYQISLIANKPVVKDDEVVHHFRYYDEERGISLGGRTHIITLELSKLDEIAQKVVEEMTALERWLVFFKYTPDKRKRKLVNEIIKKEEGIAMAGEVLLSFTEEEAEYFRQLSELKYELDLQSEIVEGKRAARREGLQEGRQAEREKWQDVVANKDTEIKELHAQLAELQAKLADRK